MRAVVIATGQSDEISALSEYYPKEMITLADRPFIQHVVESLMNSGVTEFDFILSHLPEKIEQLLGDGIRWGSRFKYHLIRNSSSPYTLVRSLFLDLEEHSDIFLVHADRLPQITPGPADPDLPLPVVFCNVNTRGDLEWTGWARLSALALRTARSDINESSLGEELISLARMHGSVIRTTKVLSVRSYESLLSSQEAFLGKQFSKLIPQVRESDDRIWISRNVSLHPTALLIPPIFIGENSQIGRDVHLGPNAVIGSQCIVDARSTISDSLILSGSYVGESLELANVIVNKNRLINTSLGVAITVADDFLLGSLSEKHLFTSLAGLFSRLTAFFLLLIVWPLLLTTAIALRIFRRGPVLYKRDVVHLPADSDSTQWRTFKLWSFSSQETGSNEGRVISDLLLRFLPSLINIARGELRFVGVPPRSREEINSLPSDWRSLYLSTKAGAITEAYILYGSNPTDDELYSTEAFYSVTAGLRYDLKLIFKYLARVITGN